jgi:hypothetical protein
MRTGDARVAKSSVGWLSAITHGLPQLRSTERVIHHDRPAWAGRGRSGEL